VIEMKLYGKAFLKGGIKVTTGLRVGGGPEVVAIGGVDNPVIRDPVSNEPYVPGSSLKGKMRSLLEKAEGRERNYPPGAEQQIHICENREEYKVCKVCPVFGVPAERAFGLTRLHVRDVRLSEESRRKLEQLRTDLPYTEVKVEVVIDRVTSQANPRHMERVPAGTVFSPMELCFSFHEEKDVERFESLLQAMRLLEDDFLGGQGTRGYGKIKFEGLNLEAKSIKCYLDGEIPQLFEEGKVFSLEELWGKKEEVKEWLKKAIFGSTS
jgi:CRISPR-associated protein Csm3